MVLMGNFLVPQFPESIRDDIAFFRFPRITADLPFYEDAPIDVAMGMISPNRKARLGDDRLIQAGAEILGEADGIAQFYDRDTPLEMFTPGMEAFAQFLLQPENVDRLLDNLEMVRGRVFQ